MNESKIELTERLRREGRWSEASAFKDTALREFRAKGMKRVDAADAAWVAMAEAFPPLATEPEVAADDAELQAADVAVSNGDADTDLPGDIVWVYRNLEARAARPVDAPNAGAWSLLAWARQYRNAFYEKMLPRALVVREKLQAAEVEVGDVGLEEVERLLEEVTRNMAG